MQKTLTTRCAAVALALGSLTMTFATGANATPTLLDNVKADVAGVAVDQGQLILSRRGADDPAGDDRGGRGRGRGKDDGPNHASIEVLKSFELARRGRGRDDGPNHA